MFRRLVPVLLVIALVTTLAAPVALAQPPSDTSTVLDPDGQPGATSNSSGAPSLLAAVPTVIQTPTPTTPQLSLFDLFLVTLPRSFAPFVGI